MYGKISECKKSDQIKHVKDKQNKTGQNKGKM